MGTIYFSYFESAIGDLLLAGDGEVLNVLGFPGGKGKRRHQDGWKKDDSVFKEVGKQLSAYFAGELKKFDLKLAPQGTGFQRQVWKALQDIPHGETASYGEIASKIGRPLASRAVGAANGRNPIPVIIPCHRIIGSTGKLVGFGGGLETKTFLLNLESAAMALDL